MKTSPILGALARRYEQTQVGRTGAGGRDLILDYERFLAGAGCHDGEARQLAEQTLRDMEKAGLLALETHRLDPRLLERIRFRAAYEAELFAQLGEPTPTERRRRLAAQFAEVEVDPAVPERWRSSWQEFCRSYQASALAGSSIQPFERDDSALNAELLHLLPRLLAWPSASLIRFASCVLCNKSKRLEELSARLSQALARITRDEIRSLEDVNILSNPRFALIHGPLRIKTGGAWLDLGLLRGPFRLSLEDITSAELIETAASRCITIENETSFYELAKLRSGELLVQTSFPGSGTLGLLERLPDTLEFWHFGDSDEAGFSILADLRTRSGRDFQPLYMEPGRQPFEQESLGCPNIGRWPFYIFAKGAQPDR
ncbi:MAG: hypothetical protein JNM83_14015 [Myxococcales bacterium]|nr:hypothetical protein [Myxococcales bacterium]